MPTPLKELTKLTKGMHPAVTLGALIATAALAWYATKSYQRYKESKAEPGIG
jgi:hypothetical protein